MAQFRAKWTQLVDESLLCLADGDSAPALSALDLLGLKFHQLYGFAVGCHYNTVCWPPSYDRRQGNSIHSVPMHDLMHTKGCHCDGHTAASQPWDCMDRLWLPDGACTVTHGMPVHGAQYHQAPSICHGRVWLRLASSCFCAVAAAPMTCWSNMINQQCMLQFKGPDKLGTLPGISTPPRVPPPRPRPSRRCTTFRRW